VRGQQATHRRSLGETVFQQQLASRIQVPVRGTHDLADRIESIAPGHQCGAGLEPQIARVEMLVTLGNVWRIRHDAIEAPWAECPAPVTAYEFDVAQAQSLRIATRNLQRGDTRVGRDDANPWAGVGNRECNRAAASTKVSHGAICIAGDALQHQVDQQFRFRARDQYLGSDVQFQRVKSAHAGQIGYRFTCDAARDQRIEGRALVRSDHIAGMRDQPRAGCRKHVAKQDFRLTFRIGAAQLTRGCAQNFPNCTHFWKCDIAGKVPPRTPLDRPETNPR
jgi:hypothetical protein